MLATLGRFRTSLKIALLSALVVFICSAQQAPPPVAAPPKPPEVPAPPPYSAPAAPGAGTSANAARNDKVAQKEAQKAAKAAAEAKKKADIADANARRAEERARAADANATAAAASERAANRERAAAFGDAHLAAEYERQAEDLTRKARAAVSGPSNATPVSLQIGPLSPGRQFVVTVQCKLSKVECARLSRPTGVRIQLGDNTASVAFTPIAAGDDNWTVALSDDVALVPGMLVQVLSSGGIYKSKIEPVLPSKAQIGCCEFSETSIRARIPVAGPLTLRVDGADGQLKLFHSSPMPDAGNDYWWTFSFDHLKFAAGDAYSFTNDVDGGANPLASGKIPALGATLAPPAPAGPAPAAAGSAPVVAATGQCNDPMIAPGVAGNNTLTVTFSCVPKITDLTVYVDNKPLAVPRDLSWAQVTPFQWKATLNLNLLPYQVVKVLQVGQVDLDSLGIVTSDSMPPVAPPPPANPWWVVTPGPCNPPTLGPIRAGDVSITVTFPPTAGVSNCDPNPFGLRIFADNIPVSPTAWAPVQGSPAAVTVTFATPFQAWQRVKALRIAPAQNAPNSVAVIVSPAPSTPAAPAPAANISQAPGLCADPFLPNAPSPGDSLSATLGCMPVDPLKDLQVKVNGKNVEVAGWTLTGLSPITVTAKLSAALQAGDNVEVHQNNQRDSFSPAQTVPTPPIAPKPPDASSIVAVSEGDKAVTGFSTSLDSVRVQVLSGNKLLQQTEASVDSKTHQFSAPLTNPVQADQQIQIYGLSKTGIASTTATPVEIEPLALDWGRVRGYFTGGVILSNNNSQFNLTNANAFLGLNIDKTWFQKTPDFNQIGRSRFDWLRVNTYFDARLTAIPTGTTGSTSSTTPTLSSGSTGSTTGTAGTSSTATTGNPSPNVSSLLTNSQAAALQVGAYLPITVGSWSFRERNYSLFAAPIAKVGFYTVTSAGSSSNQAAENANRSSGTFFPFYSYGLRLGHRRDYFTPDGRSDSNRGAEQLSYIDVSVGKWSNLEYLQPLNYTVALQPTCTVPATDPSTAACDVRKRLWRYGFEGLLIIPNTPLIIGLSANVSAQRPKGTPGSFYLRPPDDLRFLFGVRFDASKLTSILGKLGGQ
jgi:hypothetical protein